MLIFYLLIKVSIGLAPIVSVIIPTYNRAYCIKRTIDSVLNQSFKDFDIFVIDNNSIDNTEEIINSYNNPKINFKKIKNNGVIAISRNKGIFLSTAKYIAFLDSDDWWKPDKLKISVEYLENGNDFICHGLEIFRTQRNNISKEYTKNTYKFKKPFFESFLKDGNTIETSSIIVRRDIITKLGGFFESKSLSGSEDYDMWFRISSITHNFYVINNNLGYLTYGDDNYSNEIKLKKALKIIIPRFEQLCIKKESKPTYLYYLACSLYIRSGNFINALRFFKLLLINERRFVKLFKIIIKFALAFVNRALVPKKIFKKICNLL